VGVLALAVGAKRACVIETGSNTFDFTSLQARQLSISAESYQYLFTFCQPGPQACGPNQLNSSLCQSQSPWESSLGEWNGFSNWQGSVGKLTGTLLGEPCVDIGAPRQTNVTFQCGDGPASWLSMEEVSTCLYQAVVNVPQTVCSSTSRCCAPPTYVATRIEVGGPPVVVQRDGITGDWYDGDYQGRGSTLLCSTYYNRCFTFTSSVCTGAAYRPPPSDCYGDPTHTSVAQLPLLDSGSVLQTAWVAKSDGNYVVTMPLGSGSTCVAVSGSVIDTSVGFSLSPDPALWEVPQICLKTLQKF